MKKMQALTVAAASMLVLAGEAMAQATPPAAAPVSGIVGLAILAGTLAVGGAIALKKK